MKVLALFENKVFFFFTSSTGEIIKMNVYAKKSISRSLSSFHHSQITSSLALFYRSEKMENALEKKERRKKERANL